MERFFKIFYYCALVLFVAAVSYLAVMLYIAPRQDALKRGFIPCTEKMVINISDCERGSIGCPMKFLWQDTKCNIAVIAEGFAAWANGTQKTPWANYLFEPVALAEIDEDIPYNGSVAHDVEEMENQIEFIKQKQEELEAAKNRKLNLNEDVIIYDPEEEVPEIDRKEADKKSTVKEEKSGNITDEAFEEKSDDKPTESSEQSDNEENKDEK